MHTVLLHILISVGERKKARHHIVAMTGGGFLSVRVCWLRWDFMWEQRLLARRRGFPAVALSGRRAVPRRILEFVEELRACGIILLCCAVSANLSPGVSASALSFSLVAAPRSDE